ncbi:MAG: hypothetical protein K2Q15_17020, partial [Burkholderiales bacterium]|nr:hypothetical protein [Burkholderiales bacterium]
GGTRLIARDPITKKIAGHGRVIEGSRFKQVAAGAFHILSIAVAQSHLDDINRSLGEINNKLDYLVGYLKDKDLAQLRGTVKYLEYIVNKMNEHGSPESIPSEKKNQLEAIRRDVMVWAEQHCSEITAIKMKIKNQADIDSWGGTENTHKALINLKQDLQHLVEYKNLLLRIISLVEIGTLYIDPFADVNEHDQIRRETNRSMHELEGALHELRDKANTLLAKSLWNKEETISQRRGEVLNGQVDVLKQLTSGQNEFIGSIDLLNSQIKRFRSDGNEFKMALTFDEKGEVQQVAMV